MCQNEVSIKPDAAISNRDGVGWNISKRALIFLPTVQATLQRYKDLQDIISILGMDEL